MSAVRDGDRYWQSTRLEPAPNELTPRGVLSFAPDADGSVWIQAHASPKEARWGTRFSIVYRYGTGDVVPIAIGTLFDQQVEIRNAMGIHPWSPSCPQAFVMETTSDESPLASADLARALAEARRKKIAASIVEGRFGTRSVRGVLLHHAAPRVDQRQFAGLVANVVKLTGGGQPSCSVPNVTKMLDDVRAR